MGFPIEAAESAAGRRQVAGLDAQFVAKLYQFVCRLFDEFHVAAIAPIMLSWKGNESVGFSVGGDISEVEDVVAV